MSDNIRNFNDYRKKINRDEQATEEINIQIQDPLDFLSAEEREEYYRTQHEAMDRERQALDEDSDEFYFDEDFHIEEPEVHEEERKEPEPAIRKRSRPEPEKEKSQAIRKRTAKEAVKEKKRQPKTKAGNEEDDEDEIIPLIIVRISSIITGIIILVLIGLIFKSKVYDTYFRPELDEEAQVETVVGELAGYTRTDDRIVTTAALNLRNTPSVASDDFIVVQVPEGTVLERVCVSDDGEWAQVKYEDQLLFCVMKYATVQE
ncbi:hypothetical protein [Butyrivibrio sp. JL13D10]|uniref:hypothetical protein n=1 Tax=Butyrivibrio sp. JL13D10 TaxID=3236815 RepID=UPI0038B51091